MSAMWNRDVRAGDWSMNAMPRFDQQRNAHAVWIRKRLAFAVVGLLLAGCTHESPMETPLTGDEAVLRVLDSYNPVYRSNAENRVTDLILQGKHVLPPAMAEVGKLTALERLNLVSASLTDESLVHLRGLANLKTLRLGSTPISDRGLAHLESLQNLRHLYVPNTRVTSEATKRLRAALPNVTVHVK